MGGAPSPTFFCDAGYAALDVTWAILTRAEGAVVSRIE
jgi:hypothetical protein